MQTLVANMRLVWANRVAFKTLLEKNWVAPCILERTKILSKEESFFKLASVSVVEVLVSRRETTNSTPILFVTLVLAFGLVLLCWGFDGISLWTTSKEFKVSEALIFTFKHFFLVCLLNFDFCFFLFLPSRHSKQEHCTSENFECMICQWLF